MAVINKIITHSKTGQAYRFLQTAQSTGGQLLEMESTFPPQSSEPPAHCHPLQTENFRVLEGELTVRIGDDVRVLKTGDLLHIPAKQVHAMWNATGNITRVNWQTRPALQSEYFFETLIGLANEGKTDEAGKPGLLQMALTAKHFSKEFRLSKPPYIIQQILFKGLAPFALLFGLKPVYRKYIDKVASG